LTQQAQIQSPKPKTQSPKPNAQPPISYTPKYLAERIRAEQAAMMVRGATDGERKTITILFADIKGSTALIEELDPEDARRIVDPALQLMMEAVHRYEGYVAQALGDGIFAFFGAPIAHEDHAQRALYAALRMQEGMKRYSDQLRLEKGVPLQIRVGINTGEVVVRAVSTDDLHTDYIPVGHSTNIAARMENLATPGSIIISEHTHKLVDGYFDCHALGAASVKGVSEPLPIYEVRGIGPLQTRLQVSAKRGFSQFVGRQHELAQIQRAFALATEGHGQIVGVIGEPGVGKSRLCHEFKLLVQKRGLVLETFAIAHSKSHPYLPLIELLKNYFQITPQDDERRRKEKITGRLLTLDRSLEEVLPYILSLLSPVEMSAALREMDPQIRGRRTREAVRRLLLRESINQPLFLFFDDVQWVDGETQAFLDLLSDSIANARALLLINYRPGYQHHWGMRTYYTRLRLDPLGKQEGEALLTSLLGTEPTLAPVKQLLLEKTEGNPLFIEEIVRAFLEQGVLVRDGEGKTSLATSSSAKPLSEMQLPPTVHGILAARIDRLGAEEKGLLQTLAVIGKRIPLSLAKQVAAVPEEEVLSLLAHLQSGEFLYEEVAFPESLYTFKHALTQDVAYNSLLIEQRRILHERTAHAIEADCCREGSEQTLEEQCAELAYHYGRSGNVTKAISFLAQAGEQALQRAARAEAVEYFSRALELLRSQPDTPERRWEELRLLVARGGSLVAMEGYRHPEVERIFTQVSELSQQVEESPQLLPILMGLSRFAMVRGEYEAAHELAKRFTRVAAGTEDAASLLPAHFLLGYSAFRIGRFAVARQHLEQGIALHDRWQHRPKPLDSLLYRLAANGQDPRVGCFSWLAWVLWHLGYPDQALTQSQKAVALAQEQALPTSGAAALYFAAAVLRSRRESRAVLENADRVIAIANERESPHWIASGAFLRGWALAEDGQWDDGIVQMQEGIEGWRALGNDHLGQPLMLLAEIYGKAGRAAEGLRLLSSVIPLIAQSAERWWEAERYRVEGELTLQQEEQRAKTKEQKAKIETSTQAEAEAEACFQKAIEVARQQQAKSLELRAAVGLSRLWQRQGKRREAHALLTGLYQWFTEGFDTGDLKDAAALLQELGT
jgi:class 3 adenylate cyclase/tetratricopeptide (TPR) repeat protein